MRMYATARVVIAFVAAALGACASGPKIQAQSDPAADFSTYRTYGFFAEQQPYPSFIATYLKNAISREMDRRGYRQAEKPDLLINFDLLTREKLQLTQTPNSYYGWRRGYVWGDLGGTTDVRSYTEGTLTVDLVDRARKQLAWSGVAVGRVRDQARANPEGAANEVIASIFAMYPHTATTQ